MGQQSTCRLFELPAEIRFRIYFFMSDPKEVTTKQFAGMYLTCKFAKKEMDRECVKEMVRYIKGVLAEWKEVFPEKKLDIDFPTRFGQISCLQVRVPVSPDVEFRKGVFGPYTTYQLERHHYKKVAKVVAPLVMLHLDSFTVKYDISGSERIFPDQETMNKRYTFCLLGSMLNSVSPQKRKDWIYDLFLAYGTSIESNSY